MPTAGAFTQARARLGAGALKALFERIAQPASAAGAVGSWWRGLRLVAIDVTVLDVPDTASNEAHFGKPGGCRGEKKGAFPQARVVALTECGTHAIIGVEIGACATGETTLARGLFTLHDGMLLLVDRGFCGYDLWRRATGTGAQLCWRTRSNAVLPVAKSLEDGSYLSLLRPPRGDPNTFNLGGVQLACLDRVFGEFRWLRPVGVVEAFRGPFEDLAFDDAGV